MFACSVHGARVQGKLCTFYWAWFTADGNRYACKQRLCIECAQATFIELLKKARANTEDVAACPACGSSSANDMDPIYLTVYAPHQEPREYALTTCAMCAANIRMNAQQGCERLPDRQANGGGSGAPTPALSTWDVLP
jgi:hypothetical protein